MSACRVFDAVRGLWVVPRPEEVVRLRWLDVMIRTLGFPRELIAVEKGIASLPTVKDPRKLPMRRIDIVCFGQALHSEYPLYPLLILECKEKQITQKAIDQLMGYNAYVKAYYVGVATRDQIQVGRFDQTLQQYTFCSFLPHFNELMRGSSDAVKR